MSDALHSGFNRKITLLLCLFLLPSYAFSVGAQTDKSVESSVVQPVGSVLPSLPSGCDSSTVKGHSYFTCGGNWYMPAMQNGNIVYTVVADPNQG
ncbi:MAG TPA: DUF6515 family protein [Xanthomonadales bacterium]|nr:DUF6515 family protein [Xanthomonadales bacterium]